MNTPSKMAYPRSSKGVKYKKIIRPIWELSVGKTSVALSSGLNELVCRLVSLLDDPKTGSAGVPNEVVVICDELLR